MPNEQLNYLFVAAQLLAPQYEVHANFDYSPVAQHLDFGSGFSQVGRQAQNLHTNSPIPRPGAANAPSEAATVEATMADPTREEIDSKLDVIAAQTDAKFERVLGEMRTANAQIIGRFDTLGVQVEATKIAAQEASSRTLATRWQFFFLVLASFAAVIAVAALVMANTDYITGLVQAAIAAKH